MENHERTSIRISHLDCRVMILIVAVYEELQIEISCYVQSTIHP